MAKKKKNLQAALPSSASSAQTRDITVFVVIDSNVVLWRVQLENTVYPQSAFKFVGPYWALTLKDLPIHGMLDVTLDIRATLSGSRAFARVFSNGNQLNPDIPVVTTGAHGSGSRSYAV